MSLTAAPGGRVALGSLLLPLVAQLQPYALHQGHTQNLLGVPMPLLEPFPVALGWAGRGGVLPAPLTHPLPCGERRQPSQSHASVSPRPIRIVAAVEKWAEATGFSEHLPYIEARPWTSLLSTNSYLQAPGPSPALRRCPWESPKMADPAPS